jgi:hypothetical protein
MPLGAGPYTAPLLLFCAIALRMHCVLHAQPELRNPWDPERNKSRDTCIAVAHTNWL